MFYRINCIFQEFKSGVLGLCSLAENIMKLKAVCAKCGNDASFTYRLTDDRKVRSIKSFKLVG